MTFPDLRRAGEAGPAGPDGDAARFGTDAFYAAIGRAFVAMCLFVPVLFAIEAVDQVTGHQLDQAGGIRPHHLSGLDGVIFAPFLHSSFFPHLVANSVPLILVGTFVLAAGTRRFVYTTVLIALVSGLGVWLVGDPQSIVVGASGVVFGYLGVLLMRGVVERSWWNAGVGLLIGLLYGWQLLGVLPSAGRVSWQAHLFGFGAGLVAAVLFRRRRPALAGGTGSGWPSALRWRGTCGAASPGGAAGGAGAGRPDDTLTLPAKPLPPE